MSVLVEKKVQIEQKQAQQLQRLAETRNTTENALIETALELLFRENSAEVEAREDQELLRLMEAEDGPLPPSTGQKVNLEELRFIVGTEIPAESLRRV